MGSLFFSSFGIRRIHTPDLLSTLHLRTMPTLIRSRFSLATIVAAFVLLASTAKAQPYSGTIFIDPDIIDDSDPSTLVSVTYTGQGMETVYDYRFGWVTINAYLFDVVWDDGLTTVAMVNPEFANVIAAEVEVQTYAYALGKLPTCLRTDVNALWIHAGVYSFGGGNNAIVIHTGRGQEYIDDGILEEAFVHECTHTSLDATHANAPDWLAAQAADPDFISTYAQDFPATEDLAESYLPWLAVTHRSARISQQDYDLITQTIPNRMAYFDAMACDLYPITSAAGVGEATVAPIAVTVFPSPTSDWINVNASRPLPANARFELFAADGRLLRTWDLRAEARLDLAGIATGIHLWRCFADGAVLASGMVAIE